jgi:hypothetical protein
MLIAHGSLFDSSNPRILSSNPASKVDTIVDGYHVPAAFSHQGEGACISYNFKQDIMAHNV